MFLLNGIKFNPYTSFEHDGIQYTSNWFRSASPAEKEDLGITEVPDPVRPDERFYFAQENHDGSFTPIPKDLDPIKKQYADDIDVICGNVRALIVSKGDFISEEYRVAYDEALAYKDAGYIGDVGASIQTWVDVTGQSAQWVADDIISTRNQYVAFLNEVRDVRLKGKAAVLAASTPEELLLAKGAVDEVIAQFYASLT